MGGDGCHNAPLTRLASTEVRSMNLVDSRQAVDWLMACHAFQVPK